jgi:hypothetical protein
VQASTQSDRSANPGVGAVRIAATAGCKVGGEVPLPVRAAGSGTYGLGCRHEPGFGDLLPTYIDVGQLALCSFRSQTADFDDMNRAGHVARRHCRVGRPSR